MARRTALLLAGVLALALGEEVPVSDLVGRACSHSGLDGAPQQQATAALQSLGLATEEALENALPYLNFKEDLPSFPVSVKVALLRYFGEKKVQKEAQAGAPGPSGRTWARSRRASARRAASLACDHAAAAQ